MSRTLVVWCAPDPDVRDHPLTTPADIARAAQYRLAVDADRHLTGRVLARRAAAAWLGTTERDVRVDTEPEGRPVLPGTGLHLSITHAGDLVGVAVSTAPVGLDVQDVPALTGLLASPDIWTRGEIADLAALPGDRALRTAAQWWTAKEAVLKSLGRGLLEPAEELKIRSSPVPWHSLDVGSRHAAAVAGAASADPTTVRLTGIDGSISGC